MTRAAPILALLILAAPAMGEKLTGKVVGISDGDTITVLDETKTQHKIRLAGIDTPEKKQAFGNRAKEALSDKVFSQEVTIKWEERDRYGRIIGDVYLGCCSG